MQQINSHTQPISLLICALGGEGGGVLTQWLVEVAHTAGYAAQSTSIPGVAQRTGATTYFIEVYPLPLAALGVRKPVFSLNPIPGALDAVISSELLETARCASNGLPSPERTLIISSNARTLTTTERSAIGDGRLDTAALLQIVQSACRAHHVFDMQAIAHQHGTIVSAVMLGAIAGCGLFPFPKDAYLKVVKQGGRGVAASVAGFEAAWQFMQQASVPLNQVQQLVRDIATASAAPSKFDHYPIEIHTMLKLAHARVSEYQNAAYGEVYLSRMAHVLKAEQQADSAASHAYAATNEMARWMGLWMAFDDIIRVAELKSRASRSSRVRQESKAQATDLLKVFDHFKPGMPEFAALLPLSIAKYLLAWDRKRVQRGAEPFALPLKLGSHTVMGMLALRSLAALKHVRKYGSRYREEQALITQWVDAVIAGLQEDWQLGYELALCGRLIKGYGTTNLRGKENLLHVMHHLAHPAFGIATARAAAIRLARDAALQDEAGSALDQTLIKLGAPARPVKEQPIRWIPRPKN